jgi:hypothetical protein
MEKVATQIKKVEERTHLFYCDVCGVSLGCTTEYSDGYYPTIGDFELQWYTPKGWYEIHKCLCDNCKNQYLDFIYASLEAAGFAIDKD